MGLKSRVKTPGYEASELKKALQDFVHKNGTQSLVPKGAYNNILKNQAVKGNDLLQNKELLMALVAVSSFCMFLFLDLQAAVQDVCHNIDGMVPPGKSLKKHADDVANKLFTLCAHAPWLWLWLLFWSFFFVKQTKPKSTNYNHC